MDKEKNVYKYKAKNGTKIYEIEKKIIPETSMLYIIQNNLIGNTENEIREIYLEEEYMDAIFNALNGNIDMSYINVFDYVGIDFKSYEMAIYKEDYMRKNMYNKNFQNNPMNTNPYYNLIKVDKDFWDRLEISRNINVNECLFIDGKLEKRPWNEIDEELSKLKAEIYNTLAEDMNRHIFVAGGKLFSILFGVKTGDVDMFLYACNDETAVNIIKDFIDWKKYVDKETYGYDKYITRTKNAVTLRIQYRKLEGMIKNSIDFQFVLRLYKTPSEILHGFDVDCCCIGYDGKDIWMTERAYQSITNGYNTVNFDRLSPSYEYRLAKYGTRGMAVKVPMLNNNLIDINMLEQDFLIENNTEKFDRYRHTLKLKGLNLLLSLDYRLKRSKNKYNTISKINKLGHENSDYSTIPYKSKSDGVHGSSLYILLNYLGRTEDLYKKYSDKYMKILKKEIYYAESLTYCGMSVNANFSDDELFELDTYMCDIESIFVNYLKNNNKFYFIQYRIYSSDNKLDFIYEIPENIYNGLGVVMPWDIPRTLEFKTTNPGEQMTNTFNQLVYENNDEWYYGKYYKF